MKNKLKNPTMTECKTELEEVTQDPKNANDENDNANSVKLNFAHIPVCCQLVPDINMFQVLRSKGKALSSGGFGTTIDTRSLKSNSKGDKEAANNDISDGGKPKQTIDPKEYLFVEEVVFLHECGLLCCLETSASPELVSTPSPPILDASIIYRMLDELGMPFASYLVYAHLRSQNYRVLRHHPERYHWLTQQISFKKRCTDPQPTGDKPVEATDKVSARDMKLRIRETIRTAPIPQISDGSGSSTLAWDVYMPAKQFAKTNPGLPSFYVTSAFFNVAGLTFADLQSLLHDKAHGIPLKVATVSDSGTVVMFGVSDFGVPPIQRSTDSHYGDDED